MTPADIDNFAASLAEKRDRALANAAKFTFTADEHRGAAEAFTDALGALHIFSDGAHGEPRPIRTETPA